MTDDLERQLRELSDRVTTTEHGLPQFDRDARKKIRMRQTVAVLGVTVLMTGAVAGGFRVVDAFKRETPKRLVSANVIAAAAAATEAAGSAKTTFEGDFSFSGGGLDRSMSFTGEGAFDFAKETGAMTMNGLPGGAVEMIWVHGVTYTKYSSPGAPSEWVKVDGSQSSGSLGMDPIGSDADSILETLRQVSDGVEELGSEEVRGIVTTHYRAEIDPKEALKGLEAGGAYDVEVESFPVEIWIDSEGLVRKMSSGFEGSGAFGDDDTHMTMSMSMSMEFFDYGVEVNVEPPPDHDVMTMDEFREQMGSESTEAP